MRRMILPLMLLAAVACQPAAVELPDDDVAAINEFMATYNQALVAGDRDTWVQLWTDDVVYMLPNAPAIQGTAAMLEMSGEFTPLEDLTITVDEIDGRADLAYVRGSYALTMPGVDGGEPTAEQGKYLIVLRKTPDGTWKAAIECFNSDLPLPSMGEHMEVEEHS